MSQLGFIGDPIDGKQGKREFHENTTTCICAHSEMDTCATAISARRYIADVIDVHVGEEEKKLYDRCKTYGE